MKKNNKITRGNLSIAKAVLVVMLFFASPTFSQLTIQNNPTLKQITDAIVGPGFIIQAATLNCPNGAFALFDGINSNIGITDGVLLTSGSAMEAIGPNDTQSSGVNNGTPGDNQLDVLSGATTFDGCVLEMDLVPSCDTMRINYVFGSEEYPEFVGEEFNDVFAFFVSGPGIVGSQNVALIPGTAVPVSVNSINPTSNNQYYVNNAGGNTIQYDGFTTVLEGKVAVQMCETYHLKLAIADVVDGIYESGVFIKGNSVKCNNIVYTEQVRNLNSTEACSNGSFTFCRDGDISQPYNINIAIGGTATNGVDYQLIPNVITIPAGDTCITIDVVPIDDGVLELDETIEIVYQPGPCPIGDTISLLLTDPIPLNAGPDVQICSGLSKRIGKDSIPGATYSWSPATGLSDPNSLKPVLTLTNFTDAPVTYTYVQIANNGVCDITDTVLVTVYPNPIVEFNSNSACVNSEVSFSDVTTPDIGVAWSWDFGDNYLDLKQNPTHQYSTVGDKTVKLTITDTAGCKGTGTKNISIWDLPNANFISTDACQGDTVEFTNQSQTVNGSGGNVAKSTWDFGDFTSVSVEDDPKHIYTLAAIYTAKLTVVSDSGCSKMISKQVNVRAKPLADFLNDTICRQGEMSFDDNSTISNGIITSYAWDFGDGSTKQIGEEDPSHIYLIDGEFEVRLVISSGYGCSDSAMKKVLVLPLPEAGFYGQNVCIGSATQFTDTSTTSGSSVIANWKWNFDNSFISQAQNPQVTLADTGVHYITLVASTNKGCADTVTGQVIVLPTPVVEFGPVDVCETIENRFENLSESVYNWDTIASYSWGFGDESPASFVKNPSHTFAELGEYNVTLRVTTDSGCVAEKTKPVYVHGKPVVSFEANDVCMGATTNFVNTSSVGDGYIKKLYWDFAGLYSDSMIHYPNYTFDTIGVYPVMLTAASNYGCVDSAVQNVNVNQNPTATVIPIPDHCLGKEIQMDGSQCTTSNGTIDQFEWNYGDGFVNHGMANKYTYPLEGEYVLSLVIKDSKGCRDTLVDTLIVLGLPEMEVLTDNLCVGDSSFFAIQFAEESGFNVSAITWDFGDGETVEGDTAPSHFYNQIGDYFGAVEVESDSGCVIYKNLNVTVYNSPFAGFYVDTVCKEEPSKFISQALPPQGSFINKWEYIFPDGTVGTTSNYNHVFDSAGSYNIIQVVETNNGCRDTITQIAKVYPIPVLDFSVESVEGCAPYCTQFEGDVKVENAEVTFTEWDFGNGNVSTAANPTFCFEEEGDFSMSLTVQNSLGCTVTKTKDSFIKVYPSPVAGFFVDWNNLSESNPTVQLINTSFFLDRILWDFGDGKTGSSTGNTSHTFDSVGTYVVTQVVDNEFGCTDTSRQRINVREDKGVYIPNAFTPGVSRGVNDTFFPVVHGTLREADYNMYIYNRWGNLLYQTNNLTDSWDGSFLGKEVQEDVYVYKITFLPEGAEEGDYIMYKGHVSVIK